MMKRFLLLSFSVLCVTMAVAQNTIQDGSRWWDGTWLFTAHVDHQGNVRMKGESEEMGSAVFLLNRTDKDGCYTLSSDSSYGWLPIRGMVGWRVDYVRQDGMYFLAVRNTNGDCVYTLTLTPDNLRNCIAQQKIADERDVSWMLQNYLLNTHYLGRFSKPQIRLLRNEILARHGWRFQSKDLQEHFGSQPWYHPVADNNTIELGVIELTNLQLLKSEEAVADDDRIRFENTDAAPSMAMAVGNVITVTTEEQFINALGNHRIVQVGAEVHLNLSRILEQENQFAGVPGRAWVTIVKRDGGDNPVVISEFCNDGHQLTLKNFRGLTIRGERDSGIEVDPRYAYCLNFVDCEGCRVENLTIGHTEGGYCDGGVIGVEGGGSNVIADCDLYGCGTYGLVTRETKSLAVSKTNVHDCTYGIMELWDSKSVKFYNCDFFNNREFSLVTNNGSEGTEFRQCRFFANWPEAPLFNSNEQIFLYDCEIAHPHLGSQSLLVAPNHDCKFSDDPYTISGRRPFEIGPDAIPVSEQVKEIRKTYDDVKSQISQNADGVPLDITVTLNNGTEVSEDFSLDDVTKLHFYFNKYRINSELDYPDASTCYFMTEQWTSNGHIRYRELLFDPNEGYLLFSYMFAETHAGFAVETRYYYDAEGNVIEQKHKVGGEESTADAHSWSSADGDQELAKNYLDIFDKLMNYQHGMSADEETELSHRQGATVSGKAERLAFIRSTYAKAKEQVAKNDKSEVPHDMKIVIRDMSSGPPETTELQFFFDAVTNQSDNARQTIPHCYFISEHRSNNGMGLDIYSEYLFAPASNDLIFSYCRAKEEGEQHEWRYYFDERGSCVEVKTNADQHDNGVADRKTARRYLKIFEKMNQ